MLIAAVTKDMYKLSTAMLLKVCSMEEQCCKVLREGRVLCANEFGKNCQE